MKRGFSPLQLALVLGLFCIAWRVLGVFAPHLMPNASPLMALALVAGIYFPRRWSWAVAPAVSLVTELAMIPYSYRTVEVAFPWFTLVSLPVYLGASLLGMALASRKSLGAFAGGSVALSVLFYVAANTFCWAASALAHSTPGYAPDFGGWWQANSTGLPGYAPSWVFLRNGVIGDLVFLGLFLLVLDRELLLAPFARRSPAWSRGA